MINILLGNNYSRLSGEVPKSLSYFLDKELSYTPAGAWFMMKKVNAKANAAEAEGEENVKKWDGRIKLYFPTQGHKFFSGLLSPVGELMKNAKLQFELLDQRVRPIENLPNLKYAGKTLRDYQELSVRKSLEATRGILQVATGGGKTVIVTNLIARIKSAPFIFLVLSGDLLEQAYEELSSSLNVPIGRVGFGHYDIKPITVMTIQTAVVALNYDNPRFRLDDYKYDEDQQWDDDVVDSSEKAVAIKDLISSCVGIYIDECHHVSCKTVREVFNSSPNAYWRFGGSATPYREDGAEIYIQAMLGKKLVDISTSWLIKHKYLVPAHIINVVMDQNLGDIVNYKNVYSTHIVENEFLHKITSDIIKLFESHGVSSLTLVQQYAHGDRLVELHPSTPFVKGKMARKKRKDTLQQLRDGKIPSVIATTLADEGLDVPRLGGIIIAGGGKSITRVLQRVGRGLRLFEGKKFAMVVIFHHSKAEHLKAHGKKVLNILKQESGFTIHHSTPLTVLHDIEALLNPERTLFEEMQ